MATSDEGAVEQSETEGEKDKKSYVYLLFLSLRHGKAVPPPSSEGGKVSDRKERSFYEQRNSGCNGKL